MAATGTTLRLDRRGDAGAADHRDLLRDKVVLITGATGSVGQRIVGRLLDLEPATVRVFSRDESKQFELREAIGRSPRLRWLIGDIRDRPRLARAMEEVDIVFHAAALKHVESCEYNPFEAVLTNVMGTQNVIEAALEANVERVIMTSSDKAVNPCSTMGASKLMAEKLITAANFYKGRHRTVFASVRFGNVLGSRGSAPVLFREQIARGGPVTVTDPAMTRFIMSFDDCIDLVFRAAALARGGEVFVLRMPAVRLGDLVEVMIEELAPQFDHSPADVESVVIGPKVGEKPYEELMTADEVSGALELPEMFAVLPRFREIREFDYDYPQSQPASLGSGYDSHSAPALTREEIRTILAREGLLSRDGEKLTPWRSYSPVAQGS
jgi:UDP-N-acetylglucosamine 4,6-dehydratase